MFLISVYSEKYMYMVKFFKIFKKLKRRYQLTNLIDRKELFQKSVNIFFIYFVKFFIVIFLRRMKAQRKDLKKQQPTLVL